MKNSVKCQNCGTVNWASAANCLRCNAELNEPTAVQAALPSQVQEVLAFTPNVRPTFSRFLFGGIVLIVLLAITGYVFFGSLGIDKNNKTSFLTRLYWRKPPPTAELLQQGLEARLKCFREYRKVDSTVVNAVPAEHGPCLRGNVPPEHQTRLRELGIKTCQELQQPMKFEAGRSATVTVVKTEIIDAHFEKLPAIDPKGTAEGHPERSATIFFRATANMDYFITKESWTSGMSSDRERTAAHDTVILLLYWNEATKTWAPFEECDQKENS